LSRPAPSPAILLAVMGVWLMFYGLLLAITAFQLRHLADAAGLTPA
jgi:hypothetical protein